MPRLLALRTKAQSAKYWTSSVYVCVDKRWLLEDFAFSLKFYHFPSTKTAHAQSLQRFKLIYASTSIAAPLVQTSNASGEQLRTSVALSSNAPNKLPHPQIRPRSHSSGIPSNFLHLMVLWCLGKGADNFKGSTLPSKNEREPATSLCVYLPMPYYGS